MKRKIDTCSSRRQAGVVVHHLAFTLECEQSLQSIDERITIPYWDYTYDAHYYNATKSMVHCEGDCPGPASDDASKIPSWVLREWWESLVSGVRTIESVLKTRPSCEFQERKTQIAHCRHE